MTPRSLFSVFLILALSATAMLGLAGLRRRRPFDPECCRKMLHMGSGLMALGLPWLFQSAGPVLILSAAAFLGLLAVKHLPALRSRLGGVLEDVGRPSHGDLYFVAATGLLFLIAEGDPLLFGVPMTILTVADSAAAVVGRRCGRHRFQAGGGTKTVEGCAAFFVTAFFSGLVGLQVFADRGTVATLLLCLLLALLLTLVEAVAGGGADNFFIPLTGWLLLGVYLERPVSLLVAHFMTAAAACTTAVLLRGFAGRCESEPG